MESFIRLSPLVLASALILASCGSGSAINSLSSSLESESSSATESSSSSDDGVDHAAKLAEAIERTKKNYTYHEITSDKEDNGNTHWNDTTLRCDSSKPYYYVERYSLVNGSKEELLEKKKDFANASATCYYKDEAGKVACRSHAEEDEWRQSSLFNSNFNFQDQLIDHVRADYFVYDRNKDRYELDYEKYNDTEIASKMTLSYYGSFDYFHQVFSSFYLTVKNGVIDEYCYALHFSPRAGKGMTSSFDAECIGCFSNIGVSDTSLPTLPVYPEDLLKEEPALEKAVNSNKNNYTYKERMSVTDDQGNLVQRDYIEEVDEDSLRTYGYSQYYGHLVDDYIYPVVKESYTSSSGYTKTYYNTTLTYKDDGVDYGSYDMDVSSPDWGGRLSYLSSCHGYGLKIFKKAENGSYIPEEGKPGRYNPSEESYLDIAVKTFGHDIIGNYVSEATGESWNYHYDSISIFLDDLGNVAHVDYGYSYTYVDKEGVSHDYVVSASGSFSDIGSTKIEVPTDPDEDIVLDERLTVAKESIDVDNYSLDDRYSATGKDGNPISLALDGTNVNETIYHEERMGKYEYINASANYIADYDENESPIYRWLNADFYSYYGDDAYYACRHFTGSEYEDVSQKAVGTYTKLTPLSQLDSYLRFFTYKSTNSTTGVLTFSLGKKYLDRFGASLIPHGVNPNSASVTSISLFVNADGSIKKMTYSYSQFGHETGSAFYEGEVTFSSFGSTSITIPNFNEADYIRTDFNDIVSMLSGVPLRQFYHATAHYIGGGETGATFSTYGGVEVIAENTSTNSYFFKDGDVYERVNRGGKDYELLVMEASRNVDISKLSRDQFTLNSDGQYVAKQESLSLLYYDFLGFDKESVHGISLTIETQKSSLLLEVSYQKRFLLDDGSYASYFIQANITLLQ